MGIHKVIWGLRFRDWGLKFGVVLKVLVQKGPEYRGVYSGRGHWDYTSLGEGS